MENLKPCRRCGSIGLLKTKANGNMAVVCQNPLCRLHNLPKYKFKPSQTMAIDDWNRRENDGEL